MKTAIRIVRALAALALMLTVVIGGAWGLMTVGRLDTICTTSWSEILTRPDDGALLLGIITIVGWIAWSTATLSLVSEALAAATRQRCRLRFPGSEVLAPVSTVLVAAVLGLIASQPVGAAPHQIAPAVPVAAAQPEAAPPQIVRMGAAPAQAPDDATGRSAAPNARTHLVQAGDDLWSLAEQYYQDGALWREIAAANDTLLLVSTDHLEPGMLLVIPDLAGRDDEPSVIVQSGQTLSELASEHLGDAGHWPELAAANPGLVTDPDVIDIGWRLKLPTPADPDTRTAQAPAADPQIDTTPLNLEPCSIPPVGQNQPGESAAADQAGPQMTVAALGAGAITALAGLFFLRRRQQLAKRPLGHALPALGPDARTASIALAHAASTLPAVPAVAGEPGERGETEIALGLVQDSSAATPGGEFYCDIEGEQVTWLHGDEEAALSMATAMAFALAADPLTRVIVAGPAFGWLADLDEPRLEVYPSVDQACHRLGNLADQRAANREEDVSLGQLRADPLLSEAWSPIVVILDAMPTRLPRRLAGLGLSLIICAGDRRPADGSAAIHLEAGRAVHLPTGETFTPHLVGAPARRALSEIFEVAAATDYPPAPWWATYETAGLPVVLPTAIKPGSVEGGTVSSIAETEHPVVKLLGTIELIGARGAPPPRAMKQCVEYCAWLLENPGGTAMMMSDDLMVAEATRRSNMSRLRGWLGVDAHGGAYLPDAYSGRITLHAGITSDWEQLQALIGGGVNRVANASLVHALELVRGAPLADAAPGQWHWAEQLRHDMIATISDIAVVLARRALKAGDLDSAQWAIEKGLAVGSEDEQFAATQIQLAHLQGDDALADRLVMQLTRRTRTLGIDLSEETVTLLQEVVEGRVRLRRA